jgi:hypothetical protein
VVRSNNNHERGLSSLHNSRPYEQFQYENFCYLKKANGKYSKKYLVLMGCDLLCFKGANLEKRVFLHSLRNLFLEKGHSQIAAAALGD